MRLFRHVANAGWLLVPGMPQIRLPRIVSSIKHIPAAGEVPRKAVPNLLAASSIALLLLWTAPAVVSSRRARAAKPQLAANPAASIPMAVKSPTQAPDKALALTSFAEQVSGCSLLQRY